MSVWTWVLIARGYRARRKGALLDAHRHFAEAVSRCRRSGNSPALAHALKGLGQIERDLGRGDAARPLYEEAIAICRRERDPLRLAHTVRHLGDIHQDAGRVELAEPCYREALAIYRAHQGTARLDLANTLSAVRDTSGDSWKASAGDRPMDGGEKPLCGAELAPGV